MTRRTILAMAAFTAATGQAWSPPLHSDEAAWIDAPLGIAVTDCVYSTRGIGVRFLTDLPGPYNVSVYLPQELGLRRRMPVREVVTDTNAAFLPGNFQAVAVFVQVMPQHVAEADTNRVVLTDAEWQEHVASIRGSPPLHNTDATSSREADPRPRLQLVSDYTWVGFVKSAETNFSFSLAVNRWVGPTITNYYQDVVYTNRTDYFRAGESTPYHSVTNIGIYQTADLSMDDDFRVRTNTLARGGCMITHMDERCQHNPYPVYTHDQTAGRGEIVQDTLDFSLAGDASVGTGYRILAFEDTGAVLAQRAYSARTNASDEVYIPRGFRSLSSHGGYRYTADWEGRLYFQADTNSVPDVIGGAR